MPRNPILISLFTAVVVLVLGSVVVGRRTPDLPPLEPFLPQVEPTDLNPGNELPPLDETPTPPPVPDKASTKVNRPKDPTDESPKEPDKGFAVDWSFLSAIGNSVQIRFGDGTTLKTRQDEPFSSPTGESAVVVEIKARERVVVVKRESDGMTAEIPKAAVQIPSEDVVTPETEEGYDLMQFARQYADLMGQLTEEERQDINKGIETIRTGLNNGNITPDLMRYEKHLVAYIKTRNTVNDQQRAELLRQLSEFRDVVVAQVGDANETPFDVRRLDSMSPEMRRGAMMRLNAFREFQKQGFIPGLHR